MTKLFTFLFTSVLIIFHANAQTGSINGKIVDADSPADGFREGVKQSIQHALEKGIDDEAAIDALAGQICYRAADLSFRLKQSGERLEQYSEGLRRES